MTDLSDKSQSLSEWEEARRRAFLHDAMGLLAQRPVDLLPFEEVRQKLRLRNSRYLGLRDVPLDHIVGSTDRYSDFTREFLPRFSFLESRWQRVDMLIHSDTGLGPVELYKVGDAYFVRDGNHRVSVARQHRSQTIEAHVWEFQVRVPLGPDVDLGDIILKAARNAFLEETNADELCPDISIVLTRPDGYDYLLYEIQGFQQSIARIDGRDVPLDEAVQMWCEMVYSPVAEIIRQQDILSRFPALTEGDLYLWLRRSQEELDIRYGRHILMAEAAEDLARRYGERPSRVRRVRQGAGRLARGAGELGGRLVDTISRRSPAGSEFEYVSSAQLLSAVCADASRTPRHRFQGTSRDEWQEWHQALRERLWDLLGVGQRPRRPSSTEELSPELEEEVLINGLRRELIWLRTEGQLQVPVYVFSPVDLGGPLPAIIVFPGHGTIDQTAGLEDSYQRGNALALAKEGFVVLTMELRGFGLLGAASHLQIDTAARIVGRTWYGLLAQDAMRALDYLLTRPEVQADSIGATGVGAGGALTMYLAALDDRVRAAMINSYLSKYSLVCLDVEHCPCNDIPGIVREAEMGDVAGLIAPRPALFVNGLQDPLTHREAARESYAVAQRVYRALDTPTRIRLVEPVDLNHEYDAEIAVAWFRRWLS